MDLKSWPRARASNHEAALRRARRERVELLMRRRPDLRLQYLFSKRLRPEVRELIDEALARRQSPNL